MLHTHAPVFGPPRKHPPADERAAEGPDVELPVAERASDAARTRNSLGGSPFKQVNRQTCPALAALQTTVAQSLSSSVAQPTPPRVARRSAQKKGRTRVKKVGKPLPARRGADFAGHAGVRHLVHKSGLSSKHAALRLTQHANNGHAFQQTKRRANRRRLHTGFAVKVSAATANETASDCAPLGQKDAVGNSTVRSDGITCELVEDIALESVGDTVQQSSKDFAAQVPTRSSEFGRKYAHETTRNNVGVCSAHSAASEYAALRHCRHEDAPRAELQGDGTAGGGGVFGCVGACGQGLSTSSGYAYCHRDAIGPWESGDGTTCANADSDVPRGQGDGKYGAIGSLNVGNVANMRCSHQYAKQ
eukprot:g3362.t1